MKYHVCNFRFKIPDVNESKFITVLNLNHYEKITVEIKHGNFNIQYQFPNFRCTFRHTCQLARKKNQIIEPKMRDLIKSLISRTDWHDIEQTGR